MGRTRQENSRRVLQSRNEQAGSARLFRHYAAEWRRESGCVFAGTCRRRNERRRGNGRSRRALIRPPAFLCRNIPAAFQARAGFLFCPLYLLSCVPAAPVDVFGVPLSLLFLRQKHTKGAPVGKESIKRPNQNRVWARAPKVFTNARNFETRSHFHFFSLRFSIFTSLPLIKRVESR